MKIVIRIKGEVGLDRNVVETLYRLRLRKKYTCIILNREKEEMSMLNKVRDFVAYGDVDDSVIEKIITSRGKAIDKTKKIDVKKVIEGLKQGKDLQEFNVKPFFSLHPARGGLKGGSKQHYPNGVLGNHDKNIIKLVEKML